MERQPAQSEYLRGRLALITGCSGGIGRETALALAKRGCSIAVHYYSAKAKADALVAELTKLPGVKAVAFQADFGNYDDVRKLHAEIVEKMGHPQILFNNAGVTNTAIGFDGNIQQISVEEFEKTWKINTGSAYLLTQLCLPDMEKNKYGRIIFCSSVYSNVAAIIGGVIGPHYASSKSALHGILRWIAMRYTKDGITCNAVSPGLITETSMFPNPPPEWKNNVPVGRFGLPHEIASVVEMLAMNGYMTNKIIAADGGLTTGTF